MIIFDVHFKIKMKLVIRFKNCHKEIKTGKGVSLLLVSAHEICQRDWWLMGLMGCIKLWWSRGLYF